MGWEQLARVLAGALGPEGGFGALQAASKQERQAELENYRDAMRASQEDYIDRQRQARTFEREKKLKSMGQTELTDLQRDFILSKAGTGLFKTLPRTYPELAVAMAANPGLADEFRNHMNLYRRNQSYGLFGAGGLGEDANATYQTPAPSPVQQQTPAQAPARGPQQESSLDYSTRMLVRDKQSGRVGTVSRDRYNPELYESMERPPEPPDVIKKLNQKPAPLPWTQDAGYLPGQSRNPASILEQGVSLQTPREVIPSTPSPYVQPQTQGRFAGQQSYNVDRMLADVLRRSAEEQNKAAMIRAQATIAQSEAKKQLLKDILTKALSGTSSMPPQPYGFYAR